MKNYHKKGETRESYSERKKKLDSIKTLMKKNPIAAKSELLRELREHPNDMYCWFYYGQISQAESNFEEAEYAYTKVAESTSWNKYAGVVGLADVARIRGDITTAKRLYRKAIVEHQGENRTTYYMLSKLESADGNYKEALRILNLLDPKHNETKIEKVRVYVEIGEIETAQKLIESIFPETEIERRNLAFEKAKLAIQKGDYPAAKYYFLEARECKIKDTQYYKILSEEARFAVEAGEYQLAIDDCEEALAAKEIAHGDNYLALGLAKQHLKQFPSAMNCFRLALTEPGVSYFPKTSCGYYLASLEILIGDFESAEKTLKSCLNPTMTPRSSIVDLLVNIYIRQGKYAEAKDFIAEVMKTQIDEKERTKLEFASLIIDKQTGKISPQDRQKGNNYREKQVISYKKDEAITHIINHHQLGNLSEGNFPKTADIEALYDEVKSQLTDDNRTIVDMMDRYFIEYPNAGYSPNGEIVHRIGVVTIPGTKDILTMYPDVDNNKITRKEVKKTVGTQKNISTDRISRFNSRFANFTLPKK